MADRTREHSLIIWGDDIGWLNPRVVDSADGYRTHSAAADLPSLPTSLREPHAGQRAQ